MLGLSLDKFIELCHFDALYYYWLLIRAMHGKSAKYEINSKYIASYKLSSFTIRIICKLDYKIG